jgi:hypothetical protein
LTGKWLEISLFLASVMASLATNEIIISNQEVASERMDSSSNY